MNDPLGLLIDRVVQGLIEYEGSLSTPLHSIHWTRDDVLYGFWLQHGEDREHRRFVGDELRRAERDPEIFDLLAEWLLQMHLRENGQLSLGGHDTSGAESRGRDE